MPRTTQPIAKVNLGLRVSPITYKGIAGLAKAQGQSINETAEQLLTAGLHAAFAKDEKGGK